MLPGQKRVGLYWVEDLDDPIGQAAVSAKVKRQVSGVMNTWNWLLVGVDRGLVSRAQLELMHQRLQLQLPSHNGNGR